MPSVSEPPSGIEVAFIQFDDHDQPQRFGIGTGREHLRALRCYLKGCALTWIQPSRVASARSTRRSGMSHITATNTYSASLSHWFTNASPMAVR